MKDANKVTGYDGYFASRLRELMKNGEVTQQDLAQAIGTTRQAISQYADGSVQPNIEKLFKIATYFNVSADFLLGKTNTMGTNSTVNEICSKLGLSEKAVKMLMRSHINIVSGRPDDEEGAFNEFVNIFADINEIDVDGVTWADYYMYQDIMHFLRYKRLLPREDAPEDRSIILTAFKREWLPEEKQHKFKLHKVLNAIDEEDLLSVFLVQIQQRLRALKKKLEDENYFEDGGVAYRLKTKQEDDSFMCSYYKNTIKI